MNVELHDRLVREHMATGANLLQYALTQAQAEDPAALQDLASALRAGGLASLTATVAPASGLARLQIDITEPDGTAHQLMAVELQREVSQ
jgi:hypothetical protein